VRASSAPSPAVRDEGLLGVDVEAFARCELTLGAVRPAAGVSLGA
jgi:hypothetical protein